MAGAGFASQRTTGDGQEWNLSNFDGIEIVLNTASSDTKMYTVILKDLLLPSKSENGREQSTISWEFDFHILGGQHVEEADHKTMFIRWDDFKPTYRGKDCPEVEPLDLKHIKRMSLMMRRHVIALSSMPNQY